MTSECAAFLGKMVMKNIKKNSFPKWIWRVLRFASAATFHSLISNTEDT